MSPLSKPKMEGSEVSSILCQLAMAPKMHDQATLSLTATQSKVWEKRQLQRLFCTLEATEDMPGGTSPAPHTTVTSTSP